MAAICLVSVGALAQALTCATGQSQMIQAELMFGRNIGAHLGVTGRQWSQFMAREITPRFPEGLTVLDAAGQYRGANGRLVREPSKIVMLMFRADSDAVSRIAAIVAAYKKKFRQESVAVITRPACVGFQ